MFACWLRASGVGVAVAVAGCVAVAVTVAVAVAVTVAVAVACQCSVPVACVPAKNDRGARRIRSWLQNRNRVALLLALSAASSAAAPAAAADCSWGGTLEREGYVGALLRPWGYIEPQPRFH